MRVNLRSVVNDRTAAFLAFVLAVLAGIGDYLTGAEVGFTLLYLFPIGLATWYRGKAVGIVVSLLCWIMWFVMWVLSAPPPWHVPALIWNLFAELAVYLVIVVLVGALRRKLEAEVAERETAVEQLRHADRLNTIGKLASGIAHELGTPLNVVSGRASLIQADPSTGEASKRSAAIIVQQVDRMAAIIRNLLDFARRGGARKTSTDLRRLARETATLLEPLTSKTGTSIEVEDGAPISAEVNAGEIQQVLTNLFVNAAQAMSNGGRVRVRFEEGAATNGKHRANGSFARICVRDEGCGMPEHVLEHVFDPFFTTKDTGTGLGLSVSYGIVRDHGGWIDASSRPGEGSEFTVYLPQS
jgi:signal transduction histidine kinase